jgi:hypothetical protein
MRTAETELNRVSRKLHGLNRNTAEAKQALAGLNTDRAAPLPADSCDLKLSAEVRPSPSSISNPSPKRQRTGAVQNLADMWPDHSVARASWTAVVLYRFPAGRWVWRRCTWFSLNGEKGWG